MECKTIKGYTPEGKAIRGHKVKYDTLLEAQLEAANINKRKNVFIEREGYECNKCHKFHVGKTLRMIPNKVAKPKKDKFRSLHLKVVGTIDLSVFEKKPKEVCSSVSQIRMLEKPVINKKKKDRTMVFVGIVQTNGLIFKFYGKKKVVKIITPDGRVRLPSYKKIYGDIDINSLNYPTRKNFILKYVKDNVKTI